MNDPHTTWVASSMRVMLALVWLTVVGCQDKVPQESPNPTPSSESSDEPASSESTVANDKPDESQATAASTNTAAEESSEETSSPPKAANEGVPSEPTAKDREETTAEMSPEIQRTPEEEREVILHLSAVDACIGGIVPDAFHRNKKIAELFEWFEMSPSTYSKRQIELMKSDDVFRERFNQSRSECPTEYVDLIANQPGACLNYCKKLRVCGGANSVPSGCVSRCQSWEENIRILRNMACLERPRCSGVMACLKTASDRHKLHQSILADHRRRNVQTPDPERKRLLEAISMVVCSPPEIKGDTKALWKNLKGLGFDKQSYHAAVERLQSDPTFSEDIYARTRACFPIEKAPKWPQEKAKVKEAAPVAPSKNDGESSPTP